MFPDLSEAYVDQYDGSAWQPLGGKLNVSAGSRAESIGVASDGTNPWACWTEEVLSGSWISVNPAQLYCAHWNGSVWSRAGGILNRTGGTWAAEASMTYLNGSPYVAWTERTTPGNAIVYVQSYNGSAWTLVGGATLSKNPAAGWAFHPRLANDGVNVYLSWEEQVNLGQPSQLYVSQWDGSSWTSLGGALNMDSINGSVAHSSLTTLGSAPVAVWTEVTVGNLQQTYIKQWNGSAWTSLTKNLAQSAPACDLNGDGVVDSTDVQMAINQALGTAPCTTADLQKNGRCDVVDVQRVIASSLGGVCRVGQ